MDAIAVLQNRIEQLEAKLGLAPNSLLDGQHQQGDTVTANLLNTAQAINSATAGHEKLSEAQNMASELNNYTDPNFAENVSSLNNLFEVKTTCIYKILFFLFIYGFKKKS